MKNSAFHSVSFRLAAALSLLIVVCAAVLCFYIERFDWIIAVSALLMIFISWMLVIILFAPLSRALKELESRLNSVGRGEYGQKMNAIPQNEAARVALAFNKTALLVSEVIAVATADRDRFSIIFSNMADGIFVVDADSHIMLVNPAAQRMFKLSPEDILGNPFIEATHDAELYHVLRLCMDFGRQQSSFVETRTHHMYLGVVATPLKKGSGCILLVQDLTEIRRLETVRRDFVANISHELRTPISSLKALAETLNTGAIEDPSVAREFLERIEVEVDKLAQMTMELGELSNVESSVTPLVKTPADIYKLVSTAVERLRAQAKRARLEVVIDVPSTIPELFIDKDRMERVLVNLIHNSIKFTPPGGYITISAEWEEDGVVVSVADTGVGIDPADLPRIFERFYKADKARAGGGTGLGLAIARHTIEAHGGRIWAESQPGRGTVIRFSIPALSSN